MLPLFCGCKQEGMGKLKGAIELCRVSAAEAVDMEALSRGLFFQVLKNLPI